jgi:hypothetical protein
MMPNPAHTVLANHQTVPANHLGGTIVPSRTLAVDEEVTQGG